jgi:exopolyphosphatase/guanosine-5'-triphosphate,3'-diphosphate pyrophosphatase
MNRFASIDIGTNTVRLLIMEGDGKDDFHEIDSDRVICRLGEGIHSEKRLLDHRMGLVIETLKSFQEKCAAYGEMPIQAVATSAVREATNKTEFLDRVHRETGLRIEVIPWEEEARLTLEGVYWKLPEENIATLTFDIGGGSTEFILSEGRRITATAGTFLGVVRLTERFITRHPVDETEYNQLWTYLSAEFSKIKRELGNPQPQKLIGTAGTVTTLAALDQNIYPYDPEKIHGMTLPLENIQRQMDILKCKTLEERLKMPALEGGREDLIIAGTALVLQTMMTFNCPLLTVSEYSLREGILLKAFGK